MKIFVEWVLIIGAIGFVVLLCAAIICDSVQTQSYIGCECIYAPTGVHVVPISELYRSSPKALLVRLPDGNMMAVIMKDLKKVVQVEKTK